jgi:hypothetical protein
MREKGPNSPQVPFQMSRDLTLARMKKAEDQALQVSFSNMMLDKASN